MTSPSLAPKPTPPAAPTRRRPVDLIPGAAWILMAAIGLAGALATKAAWTSPDLPWIEGEWGVAYEDALDAEVFLHDLGVDTWGIVEWALFRTGRPGVIVGEDGWLYTSEEFATYVDDAGVVQHNARVVGDVRAAMASKGVRLVVALVPAKARVEAEHLGRYRVPAEAAARPGAFSAALQAAGVEVVDLASALSAARAEGDVFLHTDTHWTPFGARVAARAIGAALRAGTPPDWLGSATVTATPGTPAPHAGDLLRYIPLGPLQERLGPKPDTLATPTVSVATGGGLLDEVTIPVALVGTSYSDDPRWGFVGALQQELGADVLNAAAEGQGPFVSMMKYLENEAWTATPPQLVVWEIPERYLGKKDELSAYAFAEGKGW